MKIETIHKVVLLNVNNKRDLPNNFLKHYHTHLLCQYGSLKFTFNDQKLECKKGEFLFWFAESNVMQLDFSTTFKSIVLLIEKKFLNDNYPDQNWSINTMLHSRVYPILHLPERKDKEKVLHNFKLLYNRFLEKDHIFYKDILNLQMQIFLLEMWNIFSKEFERHKNTLHVGTRFESFMQLAQQNCLQQREVKFYATKLYISSKYLNHICKENSGITASEWIQRFTRERLIILLQTKNLSVSEIADEMNFNSYSFFTRYVKRLLGVTPSAYRQRLASS